MVELSEKLLNPLIGLPLHQGLWLIEKTLGMWIDDWLGEDRHTLNPQLKEVPLVVKQFVQSVLAVNNYMRKSDLSLVEHGYCLVLEFHSRMRALSNKSIEEISNAPIIGGVDDMEIRRRARMLADQIYRIDINEALAFLEHLVLSWAQRYDGEDLLRIVLDDCNYHLPVDDQLTELPNETKKKLRSYIPYWLAERTEH